MPSPSPAGVAAYFRPPTESAGESDAALLARFVATRDDAAFAALVRRHGPMVLAVCRRGSLQAADADDAFQAAFFALARDAGRIATRASVGGWLYRVAYRLSLKLAGKTARRRHHPLPAEPSAAMTSDPDLGDLKAVVDAALAGLSDKLRAVAVACLIEGRTNADAAKRLGIPVGTVDSRLNAARQKLRARLARRGVALAAVAAVEISLCADTAAAGRVAALASDLVSNALSYAAGVTPAGLEPLSSLADGVTAMTASTVTRWVAAIALSASLLGGAGWGVYTATAQDGDQPPAKAEPKAKPPAGFPDKPANPPPAATALKTADEVQAALSKELTVPSGAEITIGDVFQLLAKSNDLTVRFDTAAFVRRGVAVTALDEMRQKKIRLPAVARLPASDLLREALAHLGATHEGEFGGGVHNLLSYRIRGNQVLVIPEYRPASIPGSTTGAGEQPLLMITQNQMAENIYGEPVTLRIKNKSFSEVLEQLREMTGANIVVDARMKDRADAAITASFNDARLYTVLKVLGDSCEMRPVVMDNVYYLTTPENAEKLQTQIDRDLFGLPQPPIPVPGFGGLGGPGR
jgi:RNA polymerase sigma factor (sigma-70 family)